MELNTDPLQQRERIHAMQQDLEVMERKIVRVTKAAKQMQKAHQMMSAAASEFQQSLTPFATGRKDDVMLPFIHALEKVNESQDNLGERISPMIIEALNRFVDNEVKVGLEMHTKMVRAREAYDNKLSRSKKGLAEDKKRDFDEANVRYVQKLIEVETKKEFELMDIFTTWMVCSLTHHKRSWKLLDELQPMIKQHKKKMLQDSKQYSAEEETRTALVQSSLEQKGSESDYQGYLTNTSLIGKPRRFWVVANGMLAQYRKYSDFAPAESYDLLLFTVKPVPEDPSAFGLVSPNENMVLQAGSAEEKSQWMTAIAASISDQLNSQQLSSGGSSGGGSSGGTNGGRVATNDPAHPLQRIRRGNASFSKCVDCGAASPDWAAINLGIMFCINCSGIHRNLGVHISQVRSLTLDVDVWDDDLMRMMTGIGNAISNSVWEANYHGSPPRPTLGCDMKVREAFILAKYREKDFVGFAGPPSLLQLCSADDSPSVEDALARFVSEASLDATDDQGETILHHLARYSDSLVLLEFFCRNGAPIDKPCNNGVVALQVAVRSGITKAASCLVRHGGGTGRGIERSSSFNGSAEPLSPKSPERRKRTWTSTTPRAGLKAPMVAARLSVNDQLLKPSSDQGSKPSAPATPPRPVKPLPKPPALPRHDDE